MINTPDLSVQIHDRLGRWRKEFLSAFGPAVQVRIEMGVMLEIEAEQAACGGVMGV